MGIFGFGKNKDNGKADNDKVNEGDLSEEMRILSEVEEETEAERFKRAEEGRIAIEKVAQKRKEAEDMASRASTEILDLADDNRFYLVVDDLPLDEPKAPDGLVLGGIVRGKIAVGMDVYLYHAVEDQITTTKVVALSVAGKSMDEVIDDRVTVDLERGDLPLASTPDEGASNPVSKFSVLTNVRAHGNDDPAEGPENPKLLGLTMEYARFDSDRYFYEVLAEAAVHSVFLTPVHMVREKGNRQKVGFLTLQDNSGNALFPLFTDKLCLNRNHPKQIKFDTKSTLPVDFPLAAVIGKTGVHKGILINPFGPVTVRFPVDALNGITNSGAFKKEFGELPSGDDAIGQLLSGQAGAPVERQVEVNLAPPPEAGEYRFMRDVIRKYCGAHSDIVKVGIILQTETENKDRRAYLCVMDCPEDRLAEHFKAIVGLCRPYMKAVKEMGAIPIAQAPFADQYFSEHEYTYNKLLG
jgi:hypothetical protein